jgi:MFS family permease
VLLEGKLFLTNKRVVKLMRKYCSTCADLYSDTIRRGRAVAWFITAAGFGQGIGAILSGYLAPRAWNLPYWAALTIAVVSLLLLFIAPETFEPVLLKKKAQYLRKYHGAKVYAPIELESKGMKDFVTTQVMRPAKMFTTEPLAFFTCLYLALVYSIYYSFFQAYHRVYESWYTPVMRQNIKRLTSEQLATK